MNNISINLHTSYSKIVNLHNYIQNDVGHY